MNGCSEPLTAGGAAGAGCSGEDRVSRCHGLGRVLTRGGVVARDAGALPMDGVYLYCVREKTEGGKPVCVIGLDGRRRTFGVFHGEMEAVVSHVSLEEFGAEEIRKKAKEDLEWIKEKALAHQAVVQEAFRADDVTRNVIPASFGTIFGSTERVHEALRENYSRMAETLARLRGRQEWSVKAYVMDRLKLEQTAREKAPAIRHKEVEMASVPEGMAFFMEEELKEILAREADRALGDIAETVHQALKVHADDGVRTKILGKELTGKPDPMVLNAAYLVHEQNVRAFEKNIGALIAAIRANGLYLECSGPWPAYTFSSIGVP
jgi:predicted protein tyrosine phosphatase